MSIRIALAGNPNSGKTTLFNELTGSSQHVGNWPGVTVEKKEGRLKGHRDVMIEDLPGIYSLSPYTTEEVIARNHLLNERPDAVINIVDGTNIERNLYLTTQLLETGLPVVIALNMIDVVRKQGDEIRVEKLSKALGVPVVPISALKREGIKDIAEAAVKVAGKTPAPSPEVYSPSVKDAIHSIETALGSAVVDDQRRWFAVKVFERDEAVLEMLSGSLSDTSKSEIEKAIKGVEVALDDDGESIITNERYNYIHKLMKETVKVKNTGMTTSDKIDRIVTNRWLGLPIFALVMTLVYYLSIATIGTQMTDWVNDVLFGDIVPPAVEGFLESINAADWLASLTLDGIVAGVGAVLGFLPQMAVLFLCLAILEDCGYMARIAFVMDRVFRKFGLSGKSFIPILIGTGCSVPGILASRTIENDSDRRMTIITTSFMPCSAKLPIIAMFTGALFGGSWVIGVSAYFLGIAAIIISGIILKKTRLFAGDVSPFVMELPAYHWPAIKGVLIHTWDRLWAFIKKAGTVIFLASIVIWLMTYVNWRFQMVEDIEESILASIGNTFAPIFKPLGWGDWKAVVATVNGLVAKEVVVGTFGILYGYAEVAEDGAEMWSQLQAAFTGLTAYSFMVFNLLCAPCFAAIGSIRREMGSAKWTWFTIGFQTVLAYATAFVLFQIGHWIATGMFSIGVIVALVVFAVFLYFLLRPTPVIKKEKVSSLASAPVK